MKFVFSITIQSWGTGHRVTTGKEIENDRYRNEGGPVQSGTKQSESPNPRNLSMTRLVQASCITRGGQFSQQGSKNSDKIRANFLFGSSVTNWIKL